MWIADREEVKNGTYSPSAGAFGRAWTAPKEGEATLVDDWHSCREEFHLENAKLAKWYFRHTLPKPGRGRAISEFIDRVEERLGLAEEDRTRMGPTSKRTICWVEVSNWWRKHSMRRSLFTALLRAGCDYRIHLGNFDQALADAEYLSETKEAVQRFLDGNTYYWGGYRGWARAFGDSSRRDYSTKPIVLETLLRKEPRPKKKAAAGSV